MKYNTEKLRELSIIRTGKLDSNAAVDDGEYPFFTCDPQTLRIDNWAYDTEAVLLAGNNASGNYTAKYYCGKFNAYQRTYIIETVDPKKINVRFLCYAMNEKLRLLKTMSSGSTTKFLTIKMLYDLDIPCPSIKTQESILEILGTLDDLISNSQNQIKLMEEATQRLYKHWFIEMRFPGHEKTEFENGIPKNWEKCSLGSIFDVVRGRSYTSKELSDSDGVLMINLSNIRAYGGYNRKQEKHYTGKYNKEQAVKTNDLLLGVTDMTQERRTVGRAALAPDLKTDAMISMDLVKLVPRDESTFFYYGMLNFGGYSELLSRFANGTNVLHLRPDVFDMIDVYLPEVELRNLYAEKFAVFQRRITALQDQIINAEEARERLLPKLMSGEIEL